MKELRIVHLPYVLEVRTIERGSEYRLFNRDRMRVVFQIFVDNSGRLEKVK